MGPDDSYLVQYSDDVKNFWADSSSLALGGCFKRAGQAAAPRVAVTEVARQGSICRALWCVVEDLLSITGLCIMCRGSLAGQLRRASKPH
jgi:Tocopherol cyclase